MPPGFCHASYYYCLTVLPYKDPCDYIRAHTDKTQDTFPISRSLITTAKSLLPGISMGTFWCAGHYSVSHTLVWEGRRLCSDGGKTRAQQQGRTHLSYPRAQPPHPAGRLSGRPGNILVSFAPHGQSLTPAACSALENTERSSPVRPRSPRLYASQPDTGATQSHPTPRRSPRATEAGERDAVITPSVRTGNRSSARRHCLRRF